jgi:hypothetical protein
MRGSLAAGEAAEAVLADAGAEVERQRRIVARSE